MPSDAKATTVYFKPEIHKALRLKALETSRSMSELVNDAVINALAEDEEDIRAFEERKGDATISYSEFVKELKQDGKL